MHIIMHALIIEFLVLLLLMACHVEVAIQGNIVRKSIHNCVPKGVLFVSVEYNRSAVEFRDLQVNRSCSIKIVNTHQYKQYISANMHQIYDIPEYMILSIMLDADRSDSEYTSVHMTGRANILNSFNS